MRAFLALSIVVFATFVVGAAALSGHGPAPKPRIAVANASSGLATGDYHSCALTEGGGVKCWGWNPFGELGDGHACGFSCPFVTSTTGLESGVASIAAGGYHTCAVLADGTAKCWGANLSGQIGDGTRTQRLTPVNVPGLSGSVAKLTAGYNHTCALTQAGGVQCWGNNDFGEVGDGTTITRASPVDVAGLQSGVADVSAGGFSTCAALAGGTVECWGYNSLGQLGDGTTHDSTVPVHVADVTNATQVSVGEAFACVLTSGDGVKCWGSNGEGQLGDGSTTDRTAPVDVLGLTSGVTAIASGGYHTCALTTSGGVKCWGDNPWSQLGDVQACGKLCPAPVDVSGLTSGVTAIDSGLRHSCAVLTGGGVRCWGADDTGQLATGLIHNNFLPPPLPPVEIGIKAPTPTPRTFPPRPPTPPPPLTPLPTATPSGFCGPGPDSITNGPRVGATTDHSAKVLVRSCREASVSLEYKSDGSDWSSAQSAGPEATDPNADNTAVLALSNLQPNSTYDYRILVNGQSPTTPLDGHFRTMPPEGQEAAFSFVVGTDMHLNSFPMQTVLNSVKQHDPTFAVIDGDTVLAEITQVTGISREVFDYIYRAELQNPFVQDFQANVPTMMVWSDHEIYNDWDHRTSPPYPYARAAFDEYMTAANPPTRDPAGIQFSFKAADIEVYALDERTFRSPGEKTDGPDKTMLGEAQKQDLENWLLTSTARFKFLVSDVWWNDFSGHAAYGESWPVYRTERNEIFDFIRDHHVPGVVLLSGDEHITGVFHLAPWGLYEIAPGPMSWGPAPAVPMTDPQVLFSVGYTRVFGVFSVDTTACPAMLNIQLFGENNNLLYTLPLTEADLGADTDGNGLVPCQEVAHPTPTPTRTAPPAATPTPQGMMGDANCDGRVNSIDAALILQVVAGLLSHAACQQNADVNHSGRVDAIDASVVLQYAAGLISHFPEPGVLNRSPRAQTHAPGTASHAFLGTEISVRTSILKRPPVGSSTLTGA